MLHGAHRVEKRRIGRVYWYASREGGRSFWSGTFAEELTAAAVIKKAFEEECDLRPATGFVHRLIGDYRGSPEFAALSAATRALYTQFLDLAIDRLGGLSDADLGGDKGRKLIRAWRTEAAKASPRTADQIKTVVGAVATWGRRNDRLPPSCRPTADMPSLYSAPPQETWTKAEIALAAISLPAYLGEAVLLALYTGLRRTDLTKLCWGHVDDASGVIRKPTQKGVKHGRKAVIRITPPLRALLKRIRDRERPVGALTVLTNSYGLPWTPHGLHVSLARSLTALGIEKRLHGLRRSAATYLAGQGVSSREIARQLGWSEAEAETMSAIYVDDEALLRTAQNS